MQTAYGDIAEQIVNTAAGKGGENTATSSRKRLESIVTRSATVQPQRPVTGWLLDGNQGGARGRGYMRGSANRGGRGARGGPANMNAIEHQHQHMATIISTIFFSLTVCRTTTKFLKNNKKQ